MGQFMSSMTQPGAAQPGSAEGQRGQVQSSPSSGPLLDETPVSSAPNSPENEGNNDENVLASGENSGVKDIQHKFKSLSLDPRSPSGIPRTPILVEDDKDTPKDGGDATATPTRGGSSSTKKPPKRGLMAKATRLLPQSKLSFEPIVQDDDNENVEEEEKVEEEEEEQVEKVDPSPIIIETCQDEEDKKEEESASKENPQKIKSVEADVNLEEEENKVRSPLANVSNDQSLVI